MPFLPSLPSLNLYLEIVMNSSSSLYANLSDTELLTKLIGVRQTQMLYRGSLGAMFTPVGTGNHSELPERCMVARELVRRWLDEELRRDCVLNSPAIVRDCLRLHFAGREHESFVAMFLDAQHRLTQSGSVIASAPVARWIGRMQTITGSVFLRWVQNPY